MDVDEAPYASNALDTDLLHVTGLEDAHDSIESLNFDDNPEFLLLRNSLSISDSDETSGSHVSLKSIFFGVRIKIARSAVEREGLELDESEALQGL